MQKNTIDARSYKLTTKYKKASENSESWSLQIKKNPMKKIPDNNK